MGYVDAPWTNGEAYAGYAGYKALAITTYRNARRLESVMAELRAAGQFDKSDAIRAIVADMKAKSASLLDPEHRARLDNENLDITN